MARALFVVFVIALGATIAVALFGAALSWRMIQKGHPERRRYRSLALIKFGFAGTSAVLLYAIWPTASVDPSLRFWFYLGFLLMAGVGFFGMLRVIIEDVAEHDVIEKFSDRAVKEKDEQLRKAEEE